MKFKLTEEQIEYNANPQDRNEGDCTIRALSLAYDMNYNNVEAELNNIARADHGKFNYITTVRLFIEKHGFKEYIDNESQNSTVDDVDDFARKNRHGVYVIYCSNRTKQDSSNSFHLVTIVDGKIYDTWDPSKYYVLGAWKISNYNRTARKIDNSLNEANNISPFIYTLGNRPEPTVKEVTIQQGTTEIENLAFWGCRSLTYINIQDSVTKIGAYAFWGCESLTSIDIPDSIIEIGRGAFLGCNALTSINIPDGVTEIDDRAFSFCKSLTSINIPGSVTRIGEKAFLLCKSLISINIPDSVTHIGSRAFADCPKLKKVTMDRGTIYEPDTFDDPSIIELVGSQPHRFKPKLKRIL